ncbi:MAG: hypothetical protein ACOC9E_05645 [Chloroflexota bacterium]
MTLLQRTTNPARVALAALALFLILLLTTTNTALAHETRTVGPYTFVVGFSNEPAFEGQANGVQLRVREGEDSDAPPIEGLEETLQVEVTHLPSETTQTMDLRAVFGDPGHYTNDWIPTAPGQYRFRFVGAIGDLEVDETFESGPDTFSSVEPADALYFPENVPAARELEGVVRGAQSSADEALGVALDTEEQIGSLRTLSFVAIALAVVSVVVAAVAFVAGRRRQ